MNDTQVTLVKKSWAKLEPIAPTAAALLYDRLFSVAPDVRALFAHDGTAEAQAHADAQRGRRQP